MTKKQKQKLKSPENSAWKHIYTEVPVSDATCATRCTIEWRQGHDNCNAPTRIRWTLFVCGLWSVVMWTLLLKCWICERYSHTKLKGKRASQKSAEQDTWIGPCHSLFIFITTQKSMWSNLIVHTTPYPHLRQCSDRRPSHPNQFASSYPINLYVYTPIYIRCISFTWYVGKPECLDRVFAHRIRGFLTCWPHLCI